MTDYGRRMTHYQLLHCALTSPDARMASLARRLPAVVRGRDARAGLLAAVGGRRLPHRGGRFPGRDRKSTRLNSSHLVISYAVFCLKKKKLLRIKGWWQSDRHAGETAKVSQTTH